MKVRATFYWSDLDDARMNWFRITFESQCGQLKVVARMPEKERRKFEEWLRREGDKDYSIELDKLITQLKIEGWS